MFIESLNREVEIGVRTRKVSRAIQEELLRDVIVVDGEATRIPALNANASEELTVKLLFGLSQDELDNLTETEYESMKKEISKKK